MMEAILLLSFLLILAIYSVLHTCKRDNRLPPSPGFSLPLLGHLHLFGKQPHTSLMKLSRKHGDLMFLKLGMNNAIVVSSPSEAKEVLKTHDLVFASRPWTLVSSYFTSQGRDMAFAPYGEHWRNLRKLCTLELLTVKQVQQFEHIRKREVSQLLIDLLNCSARNESVNLSSKFSDLTFNIMTRMVFSKSFSKDVSEEIRENALHFKEMFEAVIKLAGNVYISDVIPWLRWLDIFNVRQIQMLFKPVDEYLEKEVEEHRSTDCKDFMSVLLSLHRDGRLDRASVKAILLDIIVAGTETTAATLEWAMAELIRNPHILHKAQKELEQVTGRQRHLEEGDIPRLSYLGSIVKETFRLHPALPLLIPHESTSVCKLHNYVVPAKTRLMVNAYAIGRDERVWKEPLKFNPERFSDSSVDVRGQHYELLPFGSGRRSCPGMQLALVEVHYILGSLLNVFDWGLCDGEEVDMSEAFGLSLPRAQPLKLVPKVSKHFEGDY